MLPSFKNLGSIAIYTPDLQRALDVYRELGLESEPVAEEGPVRTNRGLTLCFANGDARLVLHDDPQRQSVEVTIRVDDVPHLYEQLAHHPDYVWLETPHHDASGWTAVLRLPDDNVYRLHGPHRLPAPPPSERTTTHR